VDLKRSGVHAYAGAVRREGERELVLRDVDEHREERDECDGPRKEAIHRPNRNRADQLLRWDLRRSRASRISRSKSVSFGSAGSLGCTGCALAGTAGVGVALRAAATSAARFTSLSALRNSSRSSSEVRRRSPTTLPRS